MGMAASQARYLALVARKSNCEFEGQQINQARLVLSNQSANLFNQMLGLSVPIPPSTSDFTKKQYSFTDGVSTYTIDKWNQLAEPDSEGYNYVVTYHYNADVFTGYQKQQSDPQVQFSIPGAYPDSRSYSTQIAAIQAALKEIASCQSAYEDSMNTLKTLQSQASYLGTYRDLSTYTGITASSHEEDFSVYHVTYGDPAANVDFTRYNTETETPADIKDAIDKLVANGALDKDFDYSEVYYNGSNFVFKSDLDALVGNESGTMTLLPLYHKAGESEDWKSVDGMQNELDNAQADLNTKKSLLDLAQATYDSMNVPSYVGNCQLTPLSELTDTQVADLKQIIADMDKEGVSTSIKRCFNTTTETYDASTYTGGVYTYTLNGKTYYATYYDLADSINGGDGINHIDDQPKLPYYGTDYINTPIEKTSKALLETDSTGRFTTVRFADDTIKYSLNVETITDDAAYQDAMNKYYYENAVYDKMVQDINAKTSLIHQEDRQLELRLKQLDTEQNALKTEMEAVQKIVKDNVEDTFKTFSQ